VSKSIVIAGASIGGLALAANLSRRRWEGRVVIATEPTSVSRRLIAGCTLRRGTLARLAAAWGCSVPTLVERLTGGKGAFHSLTGSVARVSAGGKIHFEQPLVVHARPTSELPLGLSMRHAAITEGLRCSMQELDVSLVEKPIGGPADLASLAPTDDVLLVNATLKDLLGAPALPSPRRYVVACQAPCTIAAGGLRPPLDPHTGYFPFARLEDGSHVAFFSPFYDALSPQAPWYGVNTRIVSADAGFDRERELQSLVNGFERLAAALGLELHEPAETLGSAIMPVTEGPPPQSQPGTFEAGRAFSSGAQAIYVDGMLAAATGAHAFADALNSGALDPEVAVARALRGIRFRNWVMQEIMTRPFEPVARLLRTFPWPIGCWFGIDWLR